MARQGTKDDTWSEIWRKYPGFVVSGGLHAIVVLVLLFNYKWPEKFPDAAESIPVEMLTMSQFDEVMNGEKTAKLMPKPERRADKVADIEEHKPVPPLAEAKQDVPTPDSPDKPNDDPGQADKSQAAVAPPPAPPTPLPTAPQPVAPPPPPLEPVAKVELPTPPPPAPEPQKAEPAPPEPSVAAVEPPKPDAPTPPPKPDEIKPPPDAEALAPQPPPRPKVESMKEAGQDVKPVPKPVPKPVTKPVPKPVPKLAKVKPAPRTRTPVIKEAKVAPEPPPPVVPQTGEVPKPNLVDRVANLLTSMKPKIELPKVELPKLEMPKFEARPEPPTPAPVKQAEVPKPAEKARAGDEVREAKAHSDFSLAKISALLDRDTPQRKASTGRQLSQVASLGAPNAHSDKMSPSMKAQLDGWLIDHYRGCWSYFGLGATQDYIPAVHVQMAQDGSLSARPALMNPPSDPNLRSLADSAIRAVNRCNPLEMPDRFKPFYDSWRDRVVRFDPKELS